MKLSTALTISGVCLAALAAEALLAYMMYSNFAFNMAETGQYSVQEAYTSGSMGLSAKIFYVIFGVTIAIGVAAPLISLLTMMFRRGPASDHPD